MCCCRPARQGPERSSRDRRQVQRNEQVDRKGDPVWAPRAELRRCCPAGRCTSRIALGLIFIDRVPRVSTEVIEFGSAEHIKEEDRPGDGYTAGGLAAADDVITAVLPGIEAVETPVSVQASGVSQISS